MMKNRLSATRPSKWQQLTLVITLVLLTLSALPNLYGEHLLLTISAKTNQPLTTSVEGLNQQLNANDIQALNIHQEPSHIRVVLPQGSQQQTAQQLLKSYLGDQYQVTMDSVSAAPDWLNNLGMKPIKLGLDLRGGVQFLLDVDTQLAIKAKLKQLQDETDQQLRAAKIYGVKARMMNTHTLVITGQPKTPAAEQKFNQLKADLKRYYPGFTQQNHDDQYRLIMTQTAIAELEKQIIEQNLHTMRERIEQLGITEAVTQRQGKNRIRIELPGVQDPAQARRIIGATASLDFHQLQDQGGKFFNHKDGSQLKLDPRPLLAGHHIKDAQSGFDENGLPLVQLVLDSSGGKVMTRHSQKNLGQPMITVFSEYSKNAQGKSVKTSEVINVATIQAVLGSRFSITNMSSPQEAQDLALLLRAGSLTAPVTIVAQSSIGPTLGQDNINNGFAALMLGLGIIISFMALWYRRLGLVANTALVFNIICLMGLMALIPGVVLTLPGIAGLVLTVGMAVDTNVIIFERIKHESHRGRSPLMAIEHGYNNAFATILDANLTTLITAIILYTVGFGPVKGFAVTLGLGIITSMFTGVFASRVLVKSLFNSKSQLFKGAAA